MVTMENSLEKIYKKDVKEITKEDAGILMTIPCKGRGEHILGLERSALELGGTEGVKKLKEELKNFGYSIKFKEINPLDWYPVGLRTLGLLILKKLFNLKDDDFIEMGVRAVAFSFILKFFFKYFLSRETVFKHVADYWRKHYTCGRLEPAEFHEEEEGRKGYFIIRLHDFKIHPIYCKFFLGYFLQVSKLLGGGNATIEETKCIFKGDHYDEFLVKWK